MEAMAAHEFLVVTVQNPYREKLLENTQMTSVEWGDLPSNIYMEKNCLEIPTFLEKPGYFRCIILYIDFCMLFPAKLEEKNLF